MRIKVDSRGYTIMEVLIFVAVSGLMFTVAATAINGKQATAEFKQGMNGINSQIRQVINDVDNGSFSPIAGQTCSSPGTGGPVFSGGSSPQGTSRQCIYLGKAIQFGVPDSSGGEGDKSFAIYTVTGRQYQGTEVEAKEVTNFEQAIPRVANFSNVNEINTLPWGLKVTRVITNTATNQVTAKSTLSGVGIYKTFGSYDTGGALQSGSQNVVVVPISGDINDGSFPGEVEAKTNDENILNSADITICFQGGANQYGTVTIGGVSGQHMTTRMKITNIASTECPA